MQTSTILTFTLFSDEFTCARVSELTVHQSGSSQNLTSVAPSQRALVLDVANTIVAGIIKPTHSILAIVVLILGGWLTRARRICAN